MKHLDFSKFKKLEVNDKHTVMEHPDGHQITIAHSKIHPKLRKELDALPMHKAEGGMIDSIGKENYTSTKRKDHPTINSLANNPKLQESHKLVDHLADGGPINSQGFKDRLNQVQESYNRSTGTKPTAPSTAGINSAEASPSSSEDAAQSGQEAAAAAYKARTGKKSPYYSGETPVSSEEAEKAAKKSVGKATADYSDGTPDTAVSQSDVNLPQSQSATNLPQDPNIAAASAQLQGMQGGVGDSDQQSAAPQGIPGQQKAVQGDSGGLTPEQAATGMFPGNMPNAENAYNVGQSGIALQTQAEQQQAQKEAQALKSGLAAEQSVKNDYQQHFDAIQQHRQDLEKLYTDQKVQPQTVFQRAFANKDTFGKVSTGIGMILAGMGSGLLGQENPVIKMFNQEIDRDIDAQKANLGKTEGLLHMNMQDFGNLKDATEMTRLQLGDIINHQIKMAAAKSADPIAQARGLQAASQLEAQRAPQAQELAISRTLFSGGPNGQPKVQDPALFVKYRVPAPQQAEANKELSEATTLKQKQRDLLDAFDKVSQLQTPGNRIGSPIQSHSQISALTEPLTAGLSKETAGRYTEQDAAALNKLWPSATDSKESRDLKRNALVRMSQEKLGSNNFQVLRGNGIDLQKFPQFAPEASHNVAAPETRTVNGHIYQKAQGGWQLVK